MECQRMQQDGSATLVHTILGLNENWNMSHDEQLRNGDYREY